MKVKILKSIYAIKVGSSSNNTWRVTENASAIILWRNKYPSASDATPLRATNDESSARIQMNSWNFHIQRITTTSSREILYRMAEFLASEWYFTRYSTN